MIVLDRLLTLARDALDESRIVGGTLARRYEERARDYHFAASLIATDLGLPMPPRWEAWA